MFFRHTLITFIKFYIINSEILRSLFHRDFFHLQASVVGDVKVLHAVMGAPQPTRGSSAAARMASNKLDKGVWKCFQLFCGRTLISFED